VGLATLVRENPPVAALTALWLLGPPVLFLTVKTGSSLDLSPRHLIYVLPLWAAAAGVGAARLLARRSRPMQAAALGLLTLAAAFGSTGVHDPRELRFPVGMASERELAVPAARLRAKIEPGDLLYPFSAVYLAPLPEAGRATGLPRAQVKLLVRALHRVDLPAGSVYVAVPVAKTRIRLAALRAQLGPGFSAERLGGWLILERKGPLSDRVSIADAIAILLRKAQSATSNPYQPALRRYYELGIYVAGGAEGQLRGEGQLPLKRAG
jgi:hypothetical protein